ncbi:MAG: metallophosphatase family protein [Thermoplasmata archaeon]|jgi:putative phosphoesterase|nr:metallophosphatase family protein [Thermoplasmata archaeon]
MRVAAIADVHSNIHALRAVLHEIGNASIDRIVFAGDLVGYGAFPNECFAEVRRTASHSVRGNHDTSALSRDTTGMNPHAAEAALWTSREMDADTSSFLSSLCESSRFEFGGRSFAMFHGSPRDPVEYVFEEDLGNGAVDCISEDFLVLGHTHVPFVRKVGTVTVVNPGSVGQPRDGDPRASFAVVDTTSSQVRIVRKSYDVDEAAAAILGRGLPRALAERLLAGR